MSDPFETGLDPNVMLRRWCELDCTALTQLSCEGNADPSPEEISLRNHSLFNSGAPMNPACVQACGAALPEMLARPYPVNKYFLENDGLKVARRLLNSSEGENCPPPNGTRSTSLLDRPRGLPVSAPAPSPLNQFLLDRSPTRPSIPLLPLGIIAAVGIGAFAFRSRLGFLALL